jgi:hypothetical protein
MPAAHRGLLLRGFLLALATRIALWTLPTRIVLQYVHRRVDERRASARGAAALPPERIAWGVRIPARRIPHASCLTQALAAQILLARHGYASELRVGVGREANGEFGAHAWVEVDGMIVIGGEIAHRYRALPDVRTVLSRTTRLGASSRVPSLPRT